MKNVFQRRDGCCSLSCVLRYLEDLDILLLAGSIIGLAIAHFAFSPRVRPFYPNDATLWYPYDFDETVPFWEPIVVAFAAYVPFMFIVHLVLAKLRSPLRFHLDEDLDWAAIYARPAGPPHPHATAPKPLTARWKHISDPMAFNARRDILSAIRWPFAMITSVLIALFFTEVTKRAAGRLRPDFAVRCLGTAAVPPTAYDAAVITSNADCPNPQNLDLEDGRQSFPSGHASCAFSSGFFIFMFIARLGFRAKNNIIAQVAHMFAAIPLVYSSYVAVSRTINDRHHYSDIIAGAMIGVLTAVFMVSHVVHGERQREIEYRVCDRKAMEEEDGESCSTSHEKPLPQEPPSFSIEPATERGPTEAVDPAQVAVPLG